VRFWNYNIRYDYSKKKIRTPFSAGAMALRGMSLRTLVVAFFLVASVQINLATAWSWATAPPLPRLERKGLVLAENVLDALLSERKQYTHSAV
jgi:hypothetical protein